MLVKRLAIAVVVIALIGAVVFFVPVFKVQQFEISGQHTTTVDEIESATNIRVGDNLMRIDAQSAAHGVAQLPWVDKATVTRQFPGTVGVEVQERRVVLFDGEYLIDDKGEPFITGTPPEGAIEIEGEEYVDAIAIVDSLDEQTRATVALIKAPSKFEFVLFTHDGREIYWGSAENNHDKAIAMKTVLQREGQHWNISAPTLVTLK